MSDTFSKVLEIEKRLAITKIDKPLFGQYLDELYPKPNEELKRAVTIRENTVMDIANLYRNSKCQNLDSISGTAWAAFNAVTEYIDHSNQLKGEKKMSLVLGSRAEKKREAFELAQNVFLTR